MASIEKRGNAYRIIFRFRGIKYTRALNTHEERAANFALARLEDTLHRIQLGTLGIPSGTDLADFLLSDNRAPIASVNAPTHNGTPVPTAAPAPIPTPAVLTLSDLFARYFTNLPDGGLEENTIRTMKIHQKQLEKRFGKGFLIGSLTLTDLQGYIERRARDPGRNGRKVTPITIKKAIITLRTVWNWGRQHGLIERPYPCRGLKYPKGTEKPPFMTFAEVERRAAKATPAEAADLWECVFLTLAEIDQVLAVVKERSRHTFLYPLFVFAAHTGARRSEMIRSVLTDLDFDSNLLTIHERKKSHDKRTTRQVPMSPLLRDTLKAWLAEHPGGVSTFSQGVGSRKGHVARIQCTPLTINEAHHHFRQSLQGTKWEKLHGWHVFRHSFCSNCAAKGIDQRIINAWVGHLSEDMVRRYRHLLPDQQQTAIQTVFS
jgi:integrase